jgi:hypothetical protein
MDPASIGGIVSAGFKVSCALIQFGSGLGSAGREARLIAAEIQCSCTVLKTLQDTLGRVQQSPYYSHCAAVTNDMISACLAMYTEVLDVVEDIKRHTPVNMDVDGSKPRFGVRKKVNWVFLQKPKMLILRAALEAYKNNLALALKTLDIIANEARP